MSAEVHRLLEPEGLPVAQGGSAYLDAYLQPFRRWLDCDTVTEILVNRPGEIWIEDSRQAQMQRIESAKIDDRLIQRLAEQVARVADIARRKGRELATPAEARAAFGLPAWDTPQPAQLAGAH